MAITEKTRNKCWSVCGEKRTLVHCWWDCKLVQSLWKILWRFLKILRIELPYDTGIPLLGFYSKNTKTLIQKVIFIPVFTAALFMIAKTWKQPKYPLMDEWIKKDIYKMEYYSAIKRKKSCHHDNMDVSRRYYSK